MKNDDQEDGARRGNALKRKYYEMSFDYRRGGKPGYVLENMEALAFGALVLRAPPERGFPKFKEPPRFLFDKKRGRLPRDLELYHDYWLVSDRAKTVLQAVDSEGFAFQACEVRLPHGSYSGSQYWLCDVVRVLDAVDEECSRLEIGIRRDPKYSDFGKKYYSLVRGAELVFKADVIGAAHIFRMAFLRTAIICDQALKDACTAADLAGIKFKDASNL